MAIGASMLSMVAPSSAESVDVGVLILAGLFTAITAPVIAMRVSQVVYREGTYRKDLMAIDELGDQRPEG